MAGYKKKIAGITIELDADTSALVKKLDGVSRQIGNIGKSFERVGTNLTQNVTVPIAAGFGAAIKTAADFDSQMSKVKAISGATEDEFAQLESKAREMGKQTKYSATESGEAFEYMAMAGWKTEEMLNGIEGIMNLAAASGEELGTTSDIVTDALTAFGLSAKDSAHFADVLAATATNSNTNVSMLGQSFKYAAAPAGALGYSVEDVSLALGLMANSGIKADMAGTSLRNMFQRMAKPTKESEKAMYRLGLSLYDDEGKMYSFREIMDQLRKSFSEINMSAEDYDKALDALDKGLEEGTLKQNTYEKQLEELNKQAFGAEGAEKARAAAMLGGTRAMSGLLAIANATEEDYNKLATAIDSSSESIVKLKDGSIVPLNEAMESGQEIVGEYNGQAEAMAATMQDNLSGDITILLSQLQELAISLGEIMMPLLREIVGMLQGVVDWLNTLDDSQKETIIKVAAVIAAVGPIILIIGKVITAISGIISIVSALSAVLPLLAGPVGIVIAAIAALIAIGVLLYKNWDEIKAKAEIIWNNIKKFFEITIDLIKKAVTGKFEEMKNKISTIFNNIKTVVTTIFDAIKNKVSDSVNHMFDKVKEKFEGIKNTIKNVIDFIKQLFSQDLEFPHFKLPHFDIYGGEMPWGIGNKGTPPQIDVEWYAKAMNQPYMLDGASIFGAMNGKLLGGGETGSEMIIGTNKLMDMIAKAKGGDTIFNNSFTIDGASGDPEQLAHEISYYMNLEMKRMQFAQGMI